ncbi:hypothetical protein PF006_g13806 [Phytophthora fragariae]|uniref:Uncharacterized protein n=1 Tax=Phytophthora fragariae TaxID=53985 RepID=A0A6A3TRF0_9STRA|nr:hypothetical protein PF006_g13806 [Phytophthora fragariae]
MPGWAQRGAAAEFNLVEVANEHVLVAMGDSVVVTDLVSDSPARARRRTGSHWVNAVAVQRKIRVDGAVVAGAVHAPERPLIPAIRFNLLACPDANAERDFRFLFVACSAL